MLAIALLTILEDLIEVQVVENGDTIFTEYFDGPNRENAAYEFAAQNDLEIQLAL